MCLECGAVAAGEAKGWLAYRADEPGDAPSLVFYCPECAEREFGPFQSEQEDGHAGSA